MTGTEKLITERGKTHGSFTRNAVVSQSIKRQLRGEPGWQTLTDIQREAIDMICCKLSRIMSGQGGFQDHWDDICGYANLASKEIQRDESWAEAGTR
jgi:hypothetical protein